MALMAIRPVEARIRWDRRTARPAEVAWPGHHHRVSGLASVRDERAAYPVGRGPRLTLVLDIDDGSRAAVSYDGRRRRWYVEALEPAA